MILIEGCDRLANSFDRLFDPAARATKIQAHEAGIPEFTTRRHADTGPFKEPHWIIEPERRHIDPGQVSSLDRSEL